MDRIIANVKSIRPTPASFGMLVDENGRIVAHPKLKLTLKPLGEAITGLGDITLSAMVSASEPVMVSVGR